MDLGSVLTSALTGTGKSLLLRAIISALRKKHAKKPEVISVTASTGMAASNIGGTLDVFYLVSTAKCSLAQVLRSIRGVL